MSDIIDKELILHANNDKLLIQLVKNVVINRFLHIFLFNKYFIIQR